MIFYGYGIMVLFMQLVRAYTALARQGDVIDLTLFKLPEGETVKGEQVFRPETARRMRTIMMATVKKGGTAPIEGALDFGEYPRGKGLYVVDNPGLDPISLLGLTCSGANVLLYSTGRGTPVGNPIAPAIKLTGSPDAMKLMGANMDADLTGVSLGNMTIAEGGRILFDKVVAACNGEPTIAEQLGHREYAFPLLMGAL